MQVIRASSSVAWCVGGFYVRSKENIDVRSGGGDPQEQDKEDP